MIEQAQAKGYKIEYTKRSDGGLRVTKINGVKYKSSQGNNALRSLMGTQLTKAQLHQRQQAIKKTSKTIVPDDLKKMLKQAQANWRKYKTDDYKNVRGRLSIKRVRWRLQNQGYESAKRALQSLILYSKDIASEGFKTALTDELRALLKKHYTKELEQKIKDIEDTPFLSNTIINKMLELIYDENNKIKGGARWTNARINRIVKAFDTYTKEYNDTHTPKSKKRGK